jgi:hypothetical protein
MAKKLSLMFLAFAVVAVAIPAIAGATTATLPKGTVAPVGTTITGTGSDVILQSNLLGTITCSTLNLNADITKNSGGTVEASGDNVNPTQSGCVNGSKAVTVTEVEITRVFSNTSGSGSASFVARLDIGSELKCTFTGTNVAFTFTSGTNVIKFSSAAGVSGSPAACGTLKLTGEFALEQGGTSTPLILD